MGIVVIACYKPRPGKEKELLELTETHLPILRAEGLATDREPVVMRAKDGTVIEVFEWASEAAIEAAHSNPRVQEMWEAYERVCEYVPVGTLAEAADLWATFEPVEVGEA